MMNYGPISCLCQGDDVDIYVCKQGPSFKDISMGPWEGWAVQRKQGPSFKDISMGPWEVWAM